MLDICPVSLKEANAFVAEHHRHHKPVVGHKFSIACTDGEKIVGVAIVGRPVARYLDDGWTLEVNRCCTDGTRNACSMLYAAAWRAARAMGYAVDTAENMFLIYRDSQWNWIGMEKCKPYYLKVSEWANKKFVSTFCSCGERREGGNDNVSD